MPTMVTLVTPEQAAEHLGVTPGTLAKWRVSGRGPRYVRVGSRIRYALDALDEYVAAQTRRSTADPGPQAAA